MIVPMADAGLELTLRRTVPAARERVFRAWTNADELKQWFAVAEGYTTPIAEVDLRVGGRYRLGMQPPDSSELHIAEGVYREIRPPEKIVFTWRWESMPETERDTLVTVEFIAHGNTTEVVLRHEAFAEAAQRDTHDEGWRGCLASLKRFLGKEV